MIIISVDLGKARTGLAISDKTGFLASPLCMIEEKSPTKVLEKVAQKVEENQAELIVVGLPKNMDGSSGFRAEECTATAEKIATETGIAVEMWDERCTTVLAHNALNATNTRGKTRKETVDAVAAVLILESYLEYRKNKVK